MIFKDINKLNEIIQKQKKAGKKVIWTNGCFDIMHPGHMSTFKKCKSLADIVVVGMNGDESPYWKTKPGRPINNELFRSEMLDNLKNVDYIYIFNDELPNGPVSLFKPDYVLKGGDYITEDIKEFAKEKDGIIDLTEAYKHLINKGEDENTNRAGFMPEGIINVANGGKVVVVPIVDGCSTTNIIDELQPKSFIDLVNFYKNNISKIGIDLENYITWFNKKVHIHYNRSFVIQTIKQFNIYIVDFGQNIGVEFNKSRPALVISGKKFSSKGDNLVVIPITSYYNKNGKAKKVYKTDLVINNTVKNGLDNKSIIRCGSMREVSKKRLIKLIGKLEKKNSYNIRNIIKDILNIK